MLLSNPLKKLLKNISQKVKRPRASAGSIQKDEEILYIIPTHSTMIFFCSDFFANILTDVKSASNFVYFGCRY
jgi:hypothetical protein